MGLNSIRVFEITCDKCHAVFTGADGSQPEGAIYEDSESARLDLLENEWSSIVNQINLTIGEPKLMITRAICPNCKNS